MRTTSIAAASMPSAQEGARHADETTSLVEPGEGRVGEERAVSRPESESKPGDTRAQHHEPGESYVGAAQVHVDGEPVEVGVRLRGAFQPIDGRFHWYGRIDADDVLAQQVSPGTAVTLETPHGTAEGKLSDLDPWGRYRITGLGRPPF